MKKTIMALGIAAVAMASMGGVAQAGGKHFGWKGFHKHHWGHHFKHYSYGPKHCFWVKKKKWGKYGWYFKKVYVCKPYWYH